MDPSNVILRCLPPRALFTDRRLQFLPGESPWTALVRMPEIALPGARRIELDRGNCQIETTRATSYDLLLEAGTAPLTVSTSTRPKGLIQEGNNENSRYSR